MTFETTEEEGEQCSECERIVGGTIPWGDHGEMPGVCWTCYVNPGWYREEENDDE